MPDGLEVVRLDVLDSGDWLGVVVVCNTKILWLNSSTFFTASTVKIKRLARSPRLITTLLPERD